VAYKSPTAATEMASARIPLGLTVHSPHLSLVF
jgi:hypothetical protein